MRILRLRAAEKKFLKADARAKFQADFPLYPTEYFFLLTYFTYL